MSDSVRLNCWPIRKYPVTVTATRKAIITLPNIVIIKLIVAATEKRSPKKKYVPIKAKIGCKVTRTTELATDVMFNDSNQSMKCKAKNNPEIAASTQFFLDTALISFLYFK